MPKNYLTSNNHFIKRILIIDHNAIDRMSLCEVITSVLPAREIQEAESAQHALRMLAIRAANKGLQPELIFLDLRMYATSGLGFLDEFRKLKAKYNLPCHIIGLSNLENEHLKQEVMSHALVAGFYVKPVSEKILLDIIHAVELDSYANNMNF